MEDLHTVTWGRVAKLESLKWLQGSMRTGSLSVMTIVTILLSRLTCTQLFFEWMSE
jgi:hypothetical protein